MTDQSLNEAVARKLGYVQIEDQSVDNGGEKFKTFKRGDDVRCVGSRYPLPDYSHSIAAAWEIVEFAESKGFLFQIDSHQDKEHDLWTVEFLNQDIEIEADESTDTAPMAICLAFLKLP